MPYANVMYPQVPTPSIDNLVKAESYFRVNVPHGFHFCNIELSRLSTVRSRWTVNCTSDKYSKYDISNCSKVKSELQSYYNRRDSKIEEVSSTIIINCGKKISFWTFRCSPNNIASTSFNISAKARAIYNKLKQNSNNSKTNVTSNVSGCGKQRPPGYNNIYVAKKPKDKSGFSILTSDTREVFPIEIEQQIKPRYLLLDGKNVTRQYTGRRTLTQNILSTLKNILPCCSSTSRKVVRENKSESSRQKSDIAFVSAGLMPSSTSGYDLKRCPPPAQYVNENAVAKSKLRDKGTFKVVTEYLAVSYADGELDEVPFQEVKELNKSPSFEPSQPTLLEMRHHLRCSGLPDNSLLFNLYHEFCNDLGISNVLGELSIKFDIMRSRRSVLPVDDESC